MATTVQQIDSIIKGIARLNNTPIAQGSDEHDRLAQIDEDIWSLIDDIEEQA